MCWCICLLVFQCDSATHLNYTTLYSHYKCGGVFHVFTYFGGVGWVKNIGFWNGGVMTEGKRLNGVLGI